ncbi:MAG: hypothetical protein RR274_05385, partial [Erysipelotrichaceae bacterium]
MKDELIQIFAKENSVRFNHKQKLNYEEKLDGFFNEMDYKKEIILDLGVNKNIEIKKVYRNMSMFQLDILDILEGENIKEVN